MSDLKTDFERALVLVLNGAELEKLTALFGYQRFRAICREPGIAQAKEVHKIAEAMNEPPADLVSRYHLGADRVKYSEWLEMKLAV